jgi:DNA-binding transcriptional regulator YiaG
MKFNELLQQSGMTLKTFGEYFEIPYSTLQHWKRGERECPEYLLKLIEYKLKKERS